MKKYLLLLLVLVTLLPMGVSAVPAFPARKLVKLADGTQVMATQKGDEFFCFYLSDDGRRLRSNANGVFEVMSEDEFITLADQANEVRSQNNARRLARASTAQRRVGDIRSDLRGTKKGIVLLVDFPQNDTTSVWTSGSKSYKKYSRKFTMADPKAFYTRYFNETGFSDNGAVGSVKDYFSAQSYDQFTVEFDVYGPYDMQYQESHYDHQTEGGKPSEMVKEACKLAYAEGVDFSKYDWDGDKEVDQVFVIYCGRGQNYDTDGLNGCIWPHESKLNNGSSFTPLTLGDMKISTYACSCELMGTPSYSNYPDGIGAACHEFSHCIGYPDLYDTSYSDDNCYASTYDVMSGGNYNGIYVSGKYMYNYSPACYTSYERWTGGWMTPTEISSFTEVKNMKSLATTAEAYVMYNDKNKNEYYLLENRQLTGFDKGLDGHGLLIFHVDYSRTSWTGNTVNNVGSHLRCAPLAADGSPFGSYSSSFAGDPFPGTKKVTSLNCNTTPANSVFNINTDGTYFMRKNLDSIVENSDGTISFAACRPDVEMPLNLKSSITDNSFTVTWDKAANATSYTVNVTETPASGHDKESCYITEQDFEKCYKSLVGFTDISSKMSDYGATGWSGSKLYQSPYYLKIGTASASGTLQTPVFTAPDSGEMTLGFKVSHTDASVVCTVKVTTTSGTTTAGSVTVDKEGVYVAHITGVSGRFYLTLAPASPIYVQHAYLYEGNWTAEELESSDASSAKVSAPRKIKTKEYTTTETSYTVNDINQTSTYEVKVRATDGYFVTDWSDACEISWGAEGIEPVAVEESANTDGPIYNISGQRVDASYRGIIIRNGKKYLNK